MRFRNWSLLTAAIVLAVGTVGQLSIGDVEDPGVVVPGAGEEDDHECLNARCTSKSAVCKWQNAGDPCTYCSDGGMKWYCVIHEGVKCKLINPTWIECGLQNVGTCVGPVGDLMCCGGGNNRTCKVLNCT